jgi:hypothetical protein
MVIEIVDLPIIAMMVFHSKLLVYHRVYSIQSPMMLHIYPNQIIVDLPIKNGDFPSFFVPEAMYHTGQLGQE